MVIHHDKMAYGKLDDLTEKFGEDKLARMARMLSDGLAEEGAEEGRQANENSHGSAKGDKKGDSRS